MHYLMDTLYKQMLTLFLLLVKQRNQPSKKALHKEQDNDRQNIHLEEEQIDAAKYRVFIYLNVSRMSSWFWICLFSKFKDMIEQLVVNPSTDMKLGLLNLAWIPQGCYTKIFKDEMLKKNQQSENTMKPI